MKTAIEKLTDLIKNNTPEDAAKLIHRIMRGCVHNSMISVGGWCRTWREFAETFPLSEEHADLVNTDVAAMVDLFIDQSALVDKSMNDQELKTLCAWFSKIVDNL